MDLRPGQLFARLRDSREPRDKRHTWVILSEPERDPSAILMVSFTDAAYWPDDACEFHPGEHRVFSKSSRAAYRLAETRTLAFLEAQAADGLLEPRGILTDDQLRRLRLGAWESIFIADEHLDLLEEQGLGRDDL